MCKSSVNIHAAASHECADQRHDSENIPVGPTIQSGGQAREPTSEIYLDFAWAYRFFNARLFDGKLPACIITLQRKQGAAGYFAANRFGRRERDEIYDEIALNPAHFAEETSKRI